MNLEDAELLSYSRSLSEFGEAFSYRVLKNYSVSARFRDFQNFSGVSGISSQIDTQALSLNDFQPIYINGEFFGSGYFTKFSNEIGTDVRQKIYSIDFVIPEKVDLFNLYGEYYSGVSGINNHDIQLVQNINEDWEFEKLEDQTFSYSRSLSVSMLSGVDPVGTAQNVAKLLYSGVLNLDDLSFFYPNYYNSGNLIYSESYDLFSLDFTFNQSFKFQSENPYTWLYTHTYSKDGPIASVSERGSLSASTKPRDSSVLIGFDGVLLNSFDRCSGIHSVYDSGCPLINQPTNQTVSYNNFEGRIDYSINFSNDNTLSTGCKTTITHNIDTSVGNGAIIQESVSIQGLGPRTYPTNQRYLNAKNCYQQMLLSSGDRIAAIASGINTPCLSGFVPTNLSINDSEWNGTINYSREYSSSDIYKVTPPFTSFLKGVGVNESVPLYQTFQIIGFGEEVLGGCKSGNSSLSEISTSVSVTTTGSPTIEEFLNFSYDYIEKPPSGHCGFISNGSYSFSSKSREFSLDIGYQYVNHKPLFDKSIT